MSGKLSEGLPYDPEDRDAVLEVRYRERFHCTRDEYLSEPAAHVLRMLEVANVIDELRAPKDAVVPDA